MEAEMTALLENLHRILRETLDITEFEPPMKKQCSRLSRRLRLLTPLVEELGEMTEKLPGEAVKGLSSLTEAVVEAKNLLTFGRQGSTVYMEVWREQIESNFEGVSVRLTKALGEISYEQLDISFEAKEQAGLALSQFGRAQESLGASNTGLASKELCISNKSNELEPDPTSPVGSLDRLKSIGAEGLKEESLHLREMTVAGSLRGSATENTSVPVPLENVEDLLVAESNSFAASANVTSVPLCCKGKANTELSCQTPIIPSDFCCPISLELMRDPVIISSGQTYERACIKKWFDAGHETCPKTRQQLSSRSLIPNHVLCSLITNWCELRRLTKCNSVSRVSIAEAGAIPLLSKLLYANDSLTQEHAVTALLNLSICGDNKQSIISSGALSGILHVLKNGTTQARENAAATFFSLSKAAEHKKTIGACGAIPALVSLLNEGTPRGKVDAAAALFNLCMNQGNKGRAVMAGLVPVLVTMLTEPDMLDKALAIIALLASHPDGKAALGAFNALPSLVEVVKNGSPVNKENGTAILVHLCTESPEYVLEAIDCGVIVPLLDLAKNGSERAKQKAAQLIKLIGGTAA
ncbi:hypothetical protein Tsubulata_018703 [Turnera subulata]|uniref:RING-type E3 ubiquitin transferase n=1 Tax=Turnera subulata TaxID=218843 RepID=A0A9Q0JH81_9ROSI|nr:hypothetical protein Tsubulata_018703 [Turnera subulata]